MAKILLVEDNVDLRERVVLWLKHEQHMVESAGTGADALERLDCFDYDVVVLDLGLPDLDGVEVLKKYRSKGGSTPVLILTGRNEVEEKLAGLDAGADDYLTKPFDVRELGARLRSLLRRPTEFTGTIMTYGSLEVDATGQTVKVDGEIVKLKPRELSLLEYLMRHQDKVISPDELLNRVWGSDTEASSETIYTHIKNIRRKLKAKGSEPIETVHGAGYVIRSQTG